MKNWTEENLELLVVSKQGGLTWDEIVNIFPEHTANALRKTYYRHLRGVETPSKLGKPAPKILVMDLETAPILGYVWGLWENNVGLNQIHSDWYILSYSAKWMGSSEVFYADQRDAVDIEDDSEMLKGLWKLIDEAEIILTQNGKKFDEKKMNARFILNGFTPPSSFRHIDTLQMAKKKFGFTSNKLEYMTSKLCTKYKKLTHAKFSGFELWKECLAGNLAAWEEMRIYNQMDVLSLEELYTKLAPWVPTFNFNVFTEHEQNFCQCGSIEFVKKGFIYTNTGKFQRLQCKKCGAEVKDKENLLSKEKRKSLKK